MDEDRALSKELMGEETELETTLRPDRFEDFIGQKQVKENLRVYIQAARKRSDVLDHILFSGPPGLGKTTLSLIVAKEIGTNYRATSGPVIEKPGDLAGILTSLQRGDVLFIDEIHRLSIVVEEYLYSAMEDFTINIILDQGPQARSLTIDLPKFTLIGSTTREGLLSAPFRARFGVLEKLDFYPWEDLVKVVKRSAGILEIHIDEKGTEVIAKRSRGTVRIANRFLCRIRDVAQVKGDNVITEEIALEGLRMLGVDDRGLDIMDRKILHTIVHQNGGPVGLKTIAVSVGEPEDTIEEVYEPFLIQQGFLLKTPRGRTITKLAYEHLDEEPPALDQQGTLF